MNRASTPRSRDEAGRMAAARRTADEAGKGLQS